LLLLLWYTYIILTIIIITILRIVRTYIMYYYNLYSYLLFIILKFHNSYAEPKTIDLDSIFWYRSAATESSEGLLLSLYSAGIIFLIAIFKKLSRLYLTNSNDIASLLINAVVRIPTVCCRKWQYNIIYYDISGWVLAICLPRHKYEEGYIMVKRKGSLEGGETNILILAGCRLQLSYTHPARMYKLDKPQPSIAFTWHNFRFVDTTVWVTDCVTLWRRLIYLYIDII